jgi:UTP-glucose-1-phosphate uridylyltransferase
MTKGTIMKSRDTTFFESEFPMKNTLSTSSHESILPEMHEPVIQADVETHVENPEEDNNIVTQKSKRQRVAKFFGDDYHIYTLWMILLKS